jgi:ankyrin repeat protein
MTIQIIQGTILLTCFALGPASVGELHAYAAMALPQNEKDRAPDAQSQTDGQEVQEEPESDELSPASVHLDTSSFSPLILALYRATRETKEDPILARLAEVRELIDKGSDVKASDSTGRTSLHWAVMGSSNSTKPKILTAYTEVADQLIRRGVAVNHEDIYNNTALDYLLYSPNFEMQTLLLENDAASGTLAAFFKFSDEAHSQRARGDSTVKTGVTPQAILTPGLTIPIRLNTAVWSDKSRIGDPVEAVVTAPATKGSQVLLSPGTKLDGSVLFAQKAADAYSRPRLVLDFSNIVHGDNTRSPLYARVLAVDNARLDLSYARITAPTAGVIARVSEAASSRSINRTAASALSRAMYSRMSCKSCTARGENSARIRVRLSMPPKTLREGQQILFPMEYLPL